MKTPKFTTEAQLNIDEVCADWAQDRKRMVELGLTPEELLFDCLEGADEDRVQGWHDYVEALVESM